MLRCDLTRILSEMSPNFRFFYKVDKYTNSSLWYNIKDGFDHIKICALPDDAVPEETTIKDGYIVERSWKAIFQVVKDKKYRGKRIIHPYKFWKVLHKYGIWSLDRGVKVLS